MMPIADESDIRFKTPSLQMYSSDDTDNDHNEHDIYDYKKDSYKENTS